MDQQDGYSCELRVLEPAAWHRILSSFDDAVVDQTSIYAGSRWGAGRLVHLVVRDGGKPVAAAQIVTYGLPLTGSGLALVPHGPVYSHRGSPPNGKALRVALGKLESEFARKRGMLLRLIPKPLGEGSTLLAKALVDAGYRQLPLTPENDRYLVDLGSSLVDIRRGMKPKWRYNLKRAERAGLEVVCPPVMEACHRFLNLYTDMQRRKSLADRCALDLLSTLCTELPDGQRPAILLCRHRGRDVAGAAVVTLGDTAVYLFGASNSRALPLRAGYFLQWEAVRRLHAKEGVRWYDLGGDTGDPGLRQFKSGLTGTVGRVVPRYEFESPASGLSSWLVRLALNTRQTVGQRGCDLARKLAAAWS